MSATGREAAEKAGFGRANEQTFSIANGANGSAVAAVDLGRNYACIVVECVDADGIAAATTMRAEVGYDDNAQLYRLQKANMEGEWVSGTLPDTAVAFSFVLTHAFMAQKIRLILSNVTTAIVNFKIYGVDPGIDNP